MLVVSVPEQDLVSVYKFTVGAWTLHGAAFSPTSSIKFGSDAALSNAGSTIAIGASDDTCPTCACTEGSASAYSYNSGTQTWDQVGATLYGEYVTSCVSGSDGSFGATVALSDNGVVMAVSDPDYGTGNGRVYVYTLSSNQWTQTGATIEGAFTDELFGSSLVLDANGSNLAIGSYNPSTQTGYITVYILLNNVWTETLEQFVGPTTTATGSFGNAISLSNNGIIMAVGDSEEANGEVQVYKFSNQYPI